MNDSSNIPSTPIDNAAEQTISTPVPTHEMPQTAAKKSPSWLKIVLIGMGLLAVLMFIVAAYYMGRANGEGTAQTNSALQETSSMSDTKPAENAQTVLPEATDEYEGWSTYISDAHGYSFQYPSDWQVNREVIAEEPYDWVHINPAGGKANPSNADTLAIFTYFDGTGCPQTTKKEFVVGDHTVEGISCAGDDVYTVGMKATQAVSRGNRSVILARAAPNAVGIRIRLQSDTDDTVERILKSITGLAPATN